jgi:hypothetical protein
MLQTLPAHIFEHPEYTPGALKQRNSGVIVHKLDTLECKALTAIFFLKENVKQHEVFASEGKINKNPKCMQPARFLALRQQTESAASRWHS